MRDAPRSAPESRLDTSANGPAEPGEGAISRARGALIVAAIFFAVTLGALDQFVVVTALPNIARSLGAANGVAFVVSGYLIAAAVGILVFGRFTVMFRNRTVFLAALATFVIGSALAGLSQNLSELIAFRTLQGFSSDSFLVIGFAIIADIFPPERRAQLAGLFTGTFVIATIAGPFLGSYIVDNASWRWVFYVNIPLAALSLLTGLLYLRSGAVPTRRGFDVPGVALLVGWVSAITFALVQTSQGGWAWTDPRVLGSLAAGLALLAGFLVWEPRAEHPLVPVSLFRSRVVTSGSVVSLLRGVALFSVYTFVALYVGLVLQLGGSGAADHVRDVLYFLVIPAVIGAGIGSQILRQVGYRPIMVGGLGLALVGCVLLTGITSSTPLWSLAYGFVPIGGLALPLIPIGLGFGFTFPATILGAQFAVGREETGLATSVIEFTQTIGGAMGVSLLASFLQWREGALATVPASACVSPAGCAAYAAAAQRATVGALQEVFGIVAVAVAACVVASFWFTGRLPSSDPAGSAPARPAAAAPEIPGAVREG